MGTEHFKTCCQKIWTSAYALTWLLLVLGTTIWAVAISDLAPELKDLPSNLRTGFDSVFGFADLETDSESVKSASISALAKCSVTVLQCSSLPSFPISQTVTTTSEKARITAALQNSLAKVERVTNDIYFGVDAFASTAAYLTTIVNDIAQVDAVTMPCSTSCPLYCSLYDSASGIVNGISEVNAQIDAFINGDNVKDYQKAADRVSLLYLFPVILFIAALFFCGVWYRDGTCICCRDGTKLGCLFTCCHLIWWFIFFVLVSIIAAVSIIVKHGQDQVKLDILKNSPTLDVFLDHVQTNYPEFWNVVFRGLEGGLRNIYNSSILMWVFCVVIVLYGVCMCCWRPYSKGDDSPVEVLACVPSEQKQEILA
mmetsp:Transcript_50068/g.79254  ORF Transcript_50068/g.79254 Transcript_50068/m.79254 type:complete len:369 (-) Transcript_50068:98-1204(-)